MTTAAMACGVIPLITTSGAGAESRHAIGVVIFFGMTIGTLFTLFVVPTMYTYLAKDRYIMMEKHDREESELKNL
jgi:multidrug efflux pump